jgi:hypothetical protein
VAWLVFAVATSYVVLVITFFLLRGHGWPRTAVLVLTGLVVLVDLPLCWLLLGLDGLVRDGAPLLVVGALAVWGTRAGPPVADMSDAPATR